MIYVDLQRTVAIIPENVVEGVLGEILRSPCVCVCVCVYLYVFPLSYLKNQTHQMWCPNFTSTSKGCVVQAESIVRLRSSPRAIKRVPRCEVYNAVTEFVDDSFSHLPAVSSTSVTTAVLKQQPSPAFQHRCMRTYYDGHSDFLLIIHFSIMLSLYHYSRRRQPRGRVISGVCVSVCSQKGNRL